jgi:hypothetical protein
MCKGLSWTSFNDAPLEVLENFIAPSSLPLGNLFNTGENKFWVMNLGLSEIWSRNMTGLKMPTSRLFRPIFPLSSLTLSIANPKYALQRPEICQYALILIGSVTFDYQG